MQVRGQVPVRPRRTRASQPGQTSQVQDRTLPHVPHGGILSVRTSVPLHPQRRGGERLEGTTSAPQPAAGRARLQRRDSLATFQPRQRLPSAVLRHLEHRLLLRLTQSVPEPTAASRFPRGQIARVQPPPQHSISVRWRAHRITHRTRPVLSSFTSNLITMPDRV